MVFYQKENLPECLLMLVKKVRVRHLPYFVFLTSRQRYGCTKCPWKKLYNISALALDASFSCNSTQIIWDSRHFGIRCIAFKSGQQQKHSWKLFTGVIQSSCCSLWLPNNLEIGNLELTPGKMSVNLEVWSLRSTVTGRSRSGRFSCGRRGLNNWAALGNIHWICFTNLPILMRCVEILAANKDTENGWHFLDLGM